MAKKKVLVADDERDCCELLKDYFTQNGCAVDVAYDGLEAKELLDKKKYDFIFFDCHMPELSGVDLIRIIKEKNPKAKKIMISGYGEINEEFAKLLGSDIFLSKPLSFKTLGRIIKKGG